MKTESGVRTQTEEYEFKKVLDSYTDLKGRQIQLNKGFKKFGMNSMIAIIINSFGVIKKGNTYLIGYFSDAFYEMNEIFDNSAFRGFLAHELSHICKGHLEDTEDSPYSEISFKIKDFLCTLFDINYNPGKGKEIDVDNDVIRRGLGRDLLANKIMLERRNQIPNGYTAKKLEKILRKSGSLS